MKLTGKTWTIPLVGAGALVVAYWLLQPAPLPPVEPLPHPNGYIDLVAAGNMVSGDFPDFKTATAQTLRRYVSTNRAALDRARLGLTRQCREPAEYSSGYMNRHMYDLTEGKRITQALVAEGRLAELENHPAEAATNYLTAMKLGVELARGGVLIDALVAIICESMGTRPLAAEVPLLTAEQSRALARQVEDLQAGREPMEKIIVHENAMARSYAMRSPRGLIDRVVGQRRRLHTQQRFASKYQKQCRQTLELEASLAAHSFELEKGRAAKDWNDLVPAYLQRIPLDPGTTNQLPFASR